MRAFIAQAAILGLSIATETDPTCGVTCNKVWGKPLQEFVTPSVIFGVILFFMLLCPLMTIWCCMTLNIQTPLVFPQPDEKKPLEKVIDWGKVEEVE
jgi:hypothetical protein